MSGQDSAKGPKAPKPYNPLEKRRLAESIVRELLDRPAEPLSPPDLFVGAGIYLIYYTGEHLLYKPLAALNKIEPTYPIYVGQAAAPGARKGGFTEGTKQPALFNRLSQHSGSLRQATNLNIEDFRCRYLVVDDIWIGLAESLLIERYRPLWNVVVDGFGNHDPGSGRHQGRRPNWDTLHPGRPWSSRLQPGTLSLDAIEQRVRAYLSALSQSQATPE